MKVVATWCSQPWLAGYGGKWVDQVYMFAAAKAAIHYAHKHFGRPLIYTDTLGKKILSSITDLADYEVCYDKLHTKTHRSLWAYAKILTYEAQKQPYLHFDLDFLFLEHPDPKMFMCDAMFQNIEALSAKEYDIYYGAKKYMNTFKFPDVFNVPRLESVPTPNMGCVYIRDMDLNREYTSTVKQFVEDNKEMWSLPVRPHMCIVEQQIMGLVMHRRQTRFETLLPIGATPFTENVVHFMGAAKKLKKYLCVLDSWVTNDIKQLATYLIK